MPIEAEVNAALERVRAPNLSQIVNELKRAHSSSVVREVRVCRCYVNECKRKRRIGRRRRKSEEEFTETEDGFVSQICRRRPAPVNREVLRCARCVNEVWCVRENRTPTICRIAKRALASLSITNVEQTVVTQVEVKLAHKVVLLLMLRRRKIKARGVQPVTGSEIVRQRHRIDKRTQRRIKADSGRIRGNVVGRNAGT